MKYLRGADYTDVLCEKCREAVEKAFYLIIDYQLGDSAIGHRVAQYIDDPEGPNMMAYDNGWFCGGYQGCTAGEVDEEDRPNFSEPQWVVALWLEGKDQDTFLPLAFSFEDWPVHGGCFDAVAEQLGWGTACRDDSLGVGGIYLPTSGPLIALVCWDAITGDRRFFGRMRNPVVLLPSAEINLEEWGLS